MIDYYEWTGGREAILRFGPQDGPVVLLSLPLLEEANRTRALAITMLRELAALGIAAALPDLPGQGESLLPTEFMTLARLRAAYAGAVAYFGPGRRVYGACIRSGAVVDLTAPLAGRWKLAPLHAADFLRELTRAKQSTAGGPLHDRWFRPSSAGLPGEFAHAPIEILGNLLSRELLGELFDEPPPAPDNHACQRILRLQIDPRPADRKVPGAPLWRRNEPDNDPVLAGLLAQDIADWVRQCEG